MNRTLIIAEAGVNHNGDFDTALKLIDEAAAADADFIKFQTFKTENIVSKNAKQADYQIKNNDNEDSSQSSMLKKLEIPIEWYPILKSHAEKSDIQFLSTAFDLDSLSLLNDLNPTLYKIPSGEITNLPYLEKISSYNKPIVLSTGMSTMDEVVASIEILIKKGISKEQITVLHCNTEYPTPMKDVNLKAMVTIQKTLNVNVGYSDHTLGCEVAIAAVAMGARIIEKHLTLNRTMKGPDHKASLEPTEFREMVKAIRNIEFALSGDGSKQPSPSELKNLEHARKSLHLKRNMRKGEIIQRKDIIAMRPGNGISPMEIYDVIGKKLNVDLNEQDQLNWKNIN